MNLKTLVNSKLFRLAWDSCASYMDSFTFRDVLDWMILIRNDCIRKKLTYDEWRILNFL